jgi:hypothetical protein
MIMNDTLKRDQFKTHFKALYASQNPGKLHPGEPLRIANITAQQFQIQGNPASLAVTKMWYH